MHLTPPQRSSHLHVAFLFLVLVGSQRLGVRQVDKLLPQYDPELEPGWYESWEGGRYSSQRGWVRIPLWLPTTCVALGVSGDPSEPSFPICEMASKPGCCCRDQMTECWPRSVLGPSCAALGAPSSEVWFWGILTQPYTLFLLLAADDIRFFAFVRFTTGDAMSKRSKFALITWIGENVSGLQRAKTGTDKTLVKEVVQVIGLGFPSGPGGHIQRGSPSSRD